MFDANVAELSRHRMSGGLSPIRSPFDLASMEMFVLIDELGVVSCALPTLEAAEKLLAAFEVTEGVNYFILHRMAVLSAPASQEGGAV